MTDSFKHPLQAFIDETGETYTSVAKRAATSKVSVSRICRGLQNPSLSMVRRLIAATDGALCAQDFLGQQEAAE